MDVATVVRIDAACPEFAGHHGVPLVAAGTDLELDDPVGRGAYGRVHPLRAPGTRLVAKVFDVDQLRAGGGPAPIVGAVTTLYDALKGAGDPTWPDAMLALPFQLLTVRFNGRERFVALMIDLFARGYTSPPLIDQDELRRYRRQPLDVRIALALRLAERLALLERIGFVHGDLNPENLLVDLVGGDVQVIDFDSGVVVRTGAERPRTCGKQDVCMPPETQDPSAPDGVDRQRCTLEAERWSVASLVGLLLFSVHPGFFLNEITPTSIAAYAAVRERWPDVDPAGPLFTGIERNQRAYVDMLATFRSVPAEVLALFAAVFDAGLDGSARPTAAAWVSGLAGLTEPPELEVALLCDDIVLEGDDIIVAWRTRNATHVELAPGGSQPASGSIAFPAREHTRVRVVAFNAFGSATETSPVVRVVPLPRIERLELPQFGGFVMPPLSIAAQLGRGARVAATPELRLTPRLAVPRARSGRRSARIPAPRAPRFGSLLTRRSKPPRP